jgi:hypothetical protein
MRHPLERIRRSDSGKMGLAHHFHLPPRKTPLRRLRSLKSSFSMLSSPMRFFAKSSSASSGSPALQRVFNPLSPPPRATPESWRGWNSNLSTQRVKLLSAHMAEHTLHLSSRPPSCLSSLCTGCHTFFFWIGGLYSIPNLCPKKRVAVYLICLSHLLIQWASWSRQSGLQMLSFCLQIAYCILHFCIESMNTNQWSLVFLYIHNSPRFVMIPNCVVNCLM